MSQAIWRAIAAILIEEIRKATSVTARQTIGKQYADAMAIMPAAFAHIARTENRLRKDTFTKASREDEDIAILIKPQPKSNSNYVGIEI